MSEKTGKNGGPKSRVRVTEIEVSRKAADLLDLIEDRDRTAAVKALRAGLKANKAYWSTVLKEWVDQPDYRVRHESAMAILAYAYGKPIERQIVATGTYQELSEILSRIRESPMAMKKLGHLVPSAGGQSEKP